LGTRLAEAIVHSATSNPIDPGFTGPSVFSLGARDITINGLTIDGDNPSLTSGVVFNGADIDAEFGIYGPGLSDARSTIVNNIVKNIGEIGIWITEVGSPKGDARTNSTIQFNKVQNVLGTYGQGIRLGENAFGNVKENVVSQIRNGIVIENFTATGTHPASEIDSNKVTAFGYAIRFNLHSVYTGPGFSISNNTVSSYVQAGASASRFDGIRVESIHDLVSADISGNTIIPDRASLTAAGYTRVDGIFITNTFTNSPNISITNNRISNALRAIAHTVPAVPNVTCNALYGNEVGVFVGTDIGYGGDPSTATLGVNIANNNLRNNTLFGVQNDGTSPQTNAQGNFWGAADGPSGIGTGSGDAVSADVDFSPFLNAASTCAPALPETHFPTTGPNGWFYYDDVAESVITPNDYAYGPGTPVLGIGSARMNPSSLGTNKLLFATLEFAGTRLVDINHFSYFTYVTSGDAPYVQMGIDDDVTDTDDGWKGRVVWVPSDQGAVVPGAWQYWDANEGLYYGTQAPVNTVCSVGNKCTKSELLAAFPNIGLSNGPGLGFIGFRADDNWNVSVDAVSVGTTGGFKTFDFEPTVPTLVSIVPTPSGPTNAASIDFVVTFSEPVTGFDLSDAVFSGITGTASVSGGGAVYTVTFTPDAGQDGTIDLNIAAGAANGDPNGSPTANGGSASVVYDNISPDVSLTYGGTDPTNQNLSFTATFTESVVGFDAGDITVSNGNVINFAGSGSTYTFDIDPATSGSVSVSIGAGVTNDSVGNPNTAAPPVVVQYDIDIPSVTVFHAAPASNTSPVSYTVTFSEAVTGFDASDVVLSASTTGGALVAAVTNSGDDKNYTVTVSGMANSGDVVVSIPAGAAVDTANNGNSASTPASAGSDTIAFTVDSTTTVVDPSNAAGNNWRYYDDTTNQYFSNYDFVFGPDTAPLQIGSAGMRSSVMGTDRLALTSSEFGGTPFADITKLTYDAYYATGSTGGMPDLQFNVDYDGVGGNDGWQGRVNYTPALNDPVRAELRDTWEFWDVTDANAKFWVTQAQPGLTCTQGDPCTRAEMLAVFPNMRLHINVGSDPATAFSALLFRTSTGSDAAVDNLTVGVNSENKVFDFEPSVPTLASITHSPASPTNAASIDFTVTFSEAVTGFDLTDAVFSGITGTASISGSGAVYTVTFTPSANQTGTLTLNIAAGSANGDPSGVPTMNGGSDSVVYDNAAPSVTIDEATGQTDPTSTSPINFEVEFSEPVSGFDSSDIVLDAGTSGASNVVVTGGPSSYNVAVSGMNADGVVSISFAGAAAADGVGNPSQIPVATDNNVSFVLSNTDVVVTPADLLGWSFGSDSGSGGSGSFVSGPEPNVPVGSGSVNLNVPNSGAGYVIQSQQFAGTRLDQITEIKYNTYQNNGANPGPQAISFQFDVDSDLNDGANSFEGRLVYEPYQVPSSILQGQWQEWSPLDGKWWGTGSTGRPISLLCPQSNPCTWQEILTAFPDAGIRALTVSDPTAGRVYFKAGSGWSPFDGNVDNFVIGVNSVNTTYDFEPAPPTISVNDVTVNEGNVGASTATLTVSISQISQLDTTVSVSTTDGTATTADGDYAALTGHVVTIPAGQLSATFDVTINGDVVYENNEAFDVVLSDAVNGVISDGTGTGTITNDDALPTVSVSLASGGAEPATPNTFTITLSGQSAFEVTVNADTADGTADAGSDYTASNTVVTFPAGTAVLSQNVVVATLNDITPEPVENFTLNLSAPTNATLGTASATGTIADSGAYISISGNITQFGGSGLGGVTVNLAGGATQSTTTDSNGNYIFNVGLPTGGHYLITPTPPAGKTFDPITRSYGALTTNVASADFLAYDLNNIPRNLNVVNGYTTQGSNVVVPIEMSALGNEEVISFSLDYDETFLSVVQIACGSGFPGCTINTNDTGTAVGITIMPATPVSGIVEIATVTFSTNVSPSSSQAFVNFGDSPAIRDIADGQADPLPAGYTDGFVVFTQGIEGDVTNRFTGNGFVTATDVQMVRNMQLGIEIPNPDYNEFQRADSAPIGTNGNGSITATDIQQTRRYQLGTDGPQPAAGPFSSISPLHFGELANRTKSQANIGLPAVLRVLPAFGSAGNQVTVVIETDSVGTEAVYGFSLEYDPSILLNPTMTLGSGAVTAPPVAPAGLFYNDLIPGRIGFSIDFNNRTIAEGDNREFVLITFDIAPGAPSGTIPITFTNNPAFCEISDLAANVVPATFIDGVVNILSPTAAGVAVEGRVLTAGGSPIANAQVLMTDEQGRSYSARSNSFGNFGIKGLPGGRTYILSARAKGHSFPAQTVTLNQSVTTINLVSD
jgi:hypothetical protein